MRSGEGGAWWDAVSAIDKVILSKRDGYVTWAMREGDLDTRNWIYARKQQDIRQINRRHATRRPATIVEMVTIPRDCPTIGLLRLPIGARQPPHLVRGCLFGS
jgi:hypothetical protein